MMEVKTVGSKIFGARKEKNMSQAQLAQLLFISPQAVGKWERGESTPDIVTFNRLAEILDVDLNYFSESFPSMPDKKSFEKNIDDVAPEPLSELAGNPPSAGSGSLTNFSGSNLSDSDFAGVTAHKLKFNGSALRGSDFSGADLTGSLFMGSDVSEAIFDGADLTDCILSASNLTGASFRKALLLCTEFNASDLKSAKFSGVELIGARIIKTDLRETTFENCLFNKVDFKYSDLRGLNLGGNTFIDIRFNKAALDGASFSGATLKNVSFQPTFALTNKYYRAIATICFDEAMMDKLTYATLKGVGADLSKVTVIG